MKVQLLIFLGLLNSFVFSQASDSSVHVKETKKIKALPLPDIGYMPETRTYLGAVCLFTLNLYQDSSTRTSNAKIEFTYTWNKQLILENEWMYFFKDEKWITQGNMHFSIYPDSYFGIGAETKDSSRLLFQSQRTRIQLNGLRKMNKKLFVGLGLLYNNYTKLSFFDSINTFTELNPAASAGIKLNIVNDARNSLLTPTKGSYFEIANYFNQSHQFYHRLVIDARKYYSPKSSVNPVFAGRFYQSSVSGNAPFYDYSLFGGDKLARGYFYGRFRDKNCTSLEAEYRMKLAWRFGFACFGGVSLVYNSFASIDSQSFKPNAGLGLRFLVDKKENTFLRFDYGIGRAGQNGFYVSFGESF